MWQKAKTLDNYRAQALSKGYLVLSNKYVNNHTPILHKKIKCGHEINISPKDVLQYQSCKLCTKSGYSKIAIEWLTKIDSKIIHAENGGEVKIGPYYVDGFDNESNTIYEFHGDKFHGNLDLYSEDEYCNPFDKNKTAFELFNNTIQKMQFLKSRGYNVFFVWENDYRHGKLGEWF
jgi:hypothetical protein